MNYTDKQLQEGIFIIKSYEKRARIYPADYEAIVHRLFDLGIEIQKRESALALAKTHNPKTENKFLYNHYWESKNAGNRQIKS